MTQVFFYHGASDRLAATCSLLGKAYAQRKPVLVFAPDLALAADLDRLLWTQSATGFIPHCRANSPLASETPILIADNLDQPPQEQRLLNLSEKPPPGFARFASLIEVVGTDDDSRQAGRARVRLYKEHGAEVRFLDLSENQ